MRKNYYIFVLTFLCLLCGQMGYAFDPYGEEDEEDPCASPKDLMTQCDCYPDSDECNVVTVYGHCHPLSDDYDECECDGTDCTETDSGNVCDPNSWAYDPQECNGEEEEDCNGDPGGSAYYAPCGCIDGNTGIDECDEEQIPPEEPQDPPCTITSCPAGYVLDTENCECKSTIKCPEGFTLENGHCIKKVDDDCKNRMPETDITNRLKINPGDIVNLKGPFYFPSINNIPKNLVKLSQGGVTSATLVSGSSVIQHGNYVEVPTLSYLAVTSLAGTIYGIGGFSGKDCSTGGTPTSPAPYPINPPENSVIIVEEPGDTGNTGVQPQEPCMKPCTATQSSTTSKFSITTKTGVAMCPCEEKDWMVDNDKDGYASATYRGEKSPDPSNPNWIEGKSKGVDCDDSRFSATNICDPIDPCAEIKKQQADPKFKAMISELKDPKKLELSHETGYYQAKDGNFYPMELYVGDVAGCYTPFGVVPQNENHVHNYSFVNTNGVTQINYPMPSSRDIAKVYGDYYATQQIGTDPGNNYSGIINSIGYFQLRYTGQSNNLTWDQLKAKMDSIETEENSDKFEKLTRKYYDIGGFLRFMRDTLKITDIALYQVDDTGAKKLELDANNQIKETPCAK